MPSCRRDSAFPGMGCCTHAFWPVLTCTTAVAAERSTLPPDVPSCLHLCCSYWAADCVMPLGDMFWILAVQVG